MTSEVLVDRIERRAIDRVKPFARNARTHSVEQVDQVAASIREFGFVNPILIGPDDVIIAGHARLMAAKKLGLESVPVIVLDHLNEEQRRALVIADNQLALNAGWDEEMLSLELAELKALDYDISLLGFDESELESLLGSQEVAGLTDEDAVPDVPEKPISVPGDLWRLGDHRLLCGDATATRDTDRLLGGASGDLVFTDPPYNVDYEGYTEERLTIQGDKMTAEQFEQFLRAVFASYQRVVKPGSSLYVCHPSSWQREFQDALESSGFEVRCQIVWAKNTFAWGFGRYKFQHEPIFYCHVTGERDPWYGDRSQSTVWQENKPAANRLHPTMKPVELVERALSNSSKAGDVVVDLFGGSGTTLIACERQQRKACLMEIDPRYVDVIVRRWEEFTGRKATLEDGSSFEEVTITRQSEATVAA